MLAGFIGFRATYPMNLPNLVYPCIPAIWILQLNRMLTLSMLMQVSFLQKHPPILHASSGSSSIQVYRWPLRSQAPAIRQSRRRHGDPTKLKPDTAATRPFNNLLLLRSYSL